MLTLILCQTLLLAIAWQDWKARRIPNSLVAMLAVLALLHFWIGPGISWGGLATNWGMAAAITLPGFLRSTLGAGDVKLMFATAPMWLPLEYLSVFGIGVLSLSIVMAAQAQLFKAQAAHSDIANSCGPVSTVLSNSKATFRKGLPLGTALGLGALIVMLLKTVGLLPF